MKSLKKVTITYQQIVLLKIIYDFRVEISFMSKYENFLISKRIPWDIMYFQLQ